MDRIGMGMGQRRPWEVDDGLWERIAALLPVVERRTHGVLVDRHYLTAVDGGRVILPLPKPCFEERDGKTTVVRYEVTRYERAFARLVDRAEPSGDFDRYYTEAGFVTVDNRS
ncbi:hypothetical protein ACWEQ7_05795 [Streptomyces sp. NPDC004069]